MKYIVYYSSKGGVGKSTLAKLTHLTLTQCSNKIVTGDDTDPQQHYNFWMENNPELNAKDDEEPDYFIYDTQGFHTDINETLLIATKDLDARILIPIRPVPSASSDKLSDEVREGKRIAARIKKLGVDKKCAFVLNGCDQRSKKDIAAFINELAPLGITICRKQISQRKAFGNGAFTKREIADMSELLLEVLL